MKKDSITKVVELFPEGCETSFALYDTHTALTDGLFEPTKKVKGAEYHFRPVVREVKIRWKDEKGTQRENDVTLTFVIPMTLNTQAESILLAIVKLSGLDGLRIEPDQPCLPIFDTAEQDARQKARVHTTCRKYQILKEAGMSDDTLNYKRLDFYLEALASIKIKWKNHNTGWYGTAHFMDYAANENGSLIIQLNWRLAGAMFGNYYYTVIDLNERNALGKDAAKTLHRWLSAHLWAGKSDYLLYDTLIGHIWTQEATASTKRWRLATLKNEVLPEISNLAGWTVKIDARGAQITHLRQQKQPAIKTIAENHD
jgi:Replication protein C (RepC)